MADTVEKFLQVDIYDIAVALLNIGLGHRLVGGTPWPKAVAAHGIPSLRFSRLPGLGISTRLITWGWYVPWSNCSLIAGQCAFRKSDSSSTRMPSMPGLPWFALTC